MGKAIRSEMKIVEEPQKTLSMHPKKFAMWLFMVTVMMLFAGLTSAYIVRQADGNWRYFDLPPMFYYTTVIIIVSSVTMQMAYFAAKKNNTSLLKMMVTVTAVLGIAFLIGQVVAWGQLVDISAHFVGNPSGGFVYVLTGVHGAHIISAIIFLVVVLNSAYKLRINSKNMAQMEMCTTYWHFLGILWVYLLLFLLFFR
ncbi:MAG: cytochrome oxidase subunit III [Cyclobacteriaceae bacterium]|nr:cytochrome oxidase subunit III [Cyclobacteriaceae bacterium]